MTKIMLTVAKNTASKKILSIDLETYSDIDISRSGAYRYVDDDSFEILLFAYSWDYGDVEIVDLASSEQIPSDVLQALHDSAVLKTAYNANFERTCLSKYTGKRCDPAQWECTMVLAAQVGLPLPLEMSSKILLPKNETKMREGKALITYFCRPCKPTKANGGRTRNMPKDAPDKWGVFKAYCKRDVEAENGVRERLLNHIPCPVEQQFWQLDQKINDAGVTVDEELVANAIKMDERYKAQTSNKMKDLTGLDNPKSNTQIKKWLEDTEHITIKSLGKDSIPELLQSLTSEKALRLLELRGELSKTSTAKYAAMVRCVCSDKKARGLFQFYGANRTGRFAGRLIQLQNLPRNMMPDLELAREIVRDGDYELFELLYGGKVADTLSQLVRTALIPDQGCKFIVCDFSAIEARVIAWFAKEEWVLEEFRGKGKIYEATAAQMFGIDKELIKKGNPEYALRAKGKIATLACGYQGGVGAMIAMGALNMGLSEDDLPEIVDGWRKANPGIVNWWYSVEEAAKRAIISKRTGYDEIGGIRIEYKKGNMLIYLPSGRRLCYPKAKIGLNRFDKPSITYMGMNQTTHKWETLETYGGKLAENITQATARDCLRDAMLALDEAGFDIRMHVHDEVIINEPIDGRSLEEVRSIMTKPLAWAEGLPLNAEGYETMFYKKD